MEDIRQKAQYFKSPAIFWLLLQCSVGLVVILPKKLFMYMILYTGAAPELVYINWSFPKHFGCHKEKDRDSCKVCVDMWRSVRAVVKIIYG